MSTISNRFYVTALEDGTTLHGNLVADKSLAQAYSSSGSVTPNWQNTSNTVLSAAQPTLHLTLLSGNTTVTNSNINAQKWYYNDEEIYFMSTLSSVRIGSSSGTVVTGYWSKDSNSSTTSNYKFFKVATVGGTAVAAPTLRITSNLASSENVDVDTIKFTGEYVINSSSVAFAATLQVRISAITANGYLGVVSFVDGIADITEDGQSVTMYGMLYDATGSEVETYSTRWYVNDSSSYTAGRTISGFMNAFQISEDDIVDHAIIRCEFYEGSTFRYATYVAVDDMQDPEYMYVQYNGANGNAASLRMNEVAKFTVWVGSRDDASVRSGWSSATYKVRLLDGDGATITGTVTGESSGSYTMPAVDTGDANGYRTILNRVDSYKASFGISYASVVQVGKKNISGTIIAYANT